MNAIEIIEKVREHDAELVVEDDRLLVRGRASPLPDGLRQALQEHKAELLVALGAHKSVASVLKELRPHLPTSLRGLPDDKLLVLVNWSVVASFERAIREAGRSQQKSGEGAPEISTASLAQDRRAVEGTHARKMAGGYRER